ncbi:glucosamine 6-phosphate N-acetyltransferase isoform X2 [Physcomitrium patens]|uniref:glucosamine 6-phosphate N-acetyltransferase isoform X2 n=1 Tax=Physcomitrium patens TaxID=3218 RepID=UPI000D17CA06|nr:glucosamine 6-phosphate N-acetyltransferase-like isoform X2 [Physcomitrium patens]|eukprot:XP_024394344.1 glucosamine 6-phosphate N-acetyltransferase-like isoform X2 [Physcomitrella patens]
MCNVNRTGFMQLLGQLTVAGAVSEEQFGERVKYLQELGDDHYVAVIEDTEKGQIIATGSVLIEHKFLRNCGKVGHIEDVVVDQTVRGQRLGQRIIESLTQFAKDKGCYKVILDCSVENAAFYEKCGYKRKEIQMAAYF